MIDIQQLTVFFGWCAAINLGIYIFSAVFIALFEDLTIKIHSKFVSVDPAELPKQYFNYLGNFKIILIVFSITPYLALKLMQ